MQASISLLKNYTRTKHLETLYSYFDIKDCKIHPIESSIDFETTNIKPPVIALSSLIDSYYCLPERPDMAYTHLWIAINNIYNDIAIKDKLAMNQNGKLRETDAIDLLVSKINLNRNQVIEGNTTIITLLDKYIKLIPIKTLRFVSNFILKDYVKQEKDLPPFLISQSHDTLKSKFSSIYNGIINTYGQAYKSISNPSLDDSVFGMGITDVNKSKSIPSSLADKLKQLLIDRSVRVSNSSNTSSHNLMFSSDLEYINFIMRAILYSVRNNSVHGNVIQRLNSQYKNSESLNSSIYIYYLGHYFLTLALYINDNIGLEDLKINIRNLVKLETLMS